MKKTVSIVLAVVLTLVLAVGVLADTGEVKIATSAPVNGELTGSASGSYWYAKVAYPGNDTALTLQLSFAPADPVMVKGVGFNVYTADGAVVGSGLLTDHGLKELEYSSADAQELSVEVYNYIDGAKAWFTLTAAGLPEAAAATETPAAAETEIPEAAETPAAQEAVSMEGVLAGNAGGSFARFNVSYSSDEQVTLTLFYAPADNLIAQAVDMAVYGPDGEVALDEAKTDSNGVLTVVFTPEADVTYQVVVSNYVPELPISYNIASSIVPAAVSLGG